MKVLGYGVIYLIDGRAGQKGRLIPCDIGCRRKAEGKDVKTSEEIRRGTRRAVDEDMDAEDSRAEL